MREPWSFLAKEGSASGSGSGSESRSEGRGVRPRGVRGRHVRQDLHLAIAVDSNARVRGAPGERAKREARVRESEGGAHVGRDQCVQIDTDHCGRTRRASERMGANERANERTSKRVPAVGRGRAHVARARTRTGDIVRRERVRDEEQGERDCGGGGGGGRQRNVSVWGS